jgi:hypothetical protein
MEHNTAGLGLVERTDVGSDCVAIPCSCKCGAAVLNEVNDLAKCLQLHVRDQQRRGLWRLGLELWRSCKCPPLQSAIKRSCWQLSPIGPSGLILLTMLTTAH